LPEGEPLMVSIPAPGSPEAEEIGCTCAVLDNCHGRGLFGSRGLAYSVDTECPIHAQLLPEEGEDDERLATPAE
jgi:hypothetical protein